MSQQERKKSLLTLIDRMRDCRRKQKTFRKQKNTENYKAMIASEEETDEMLSAARKNVTANKELDIDVLP